MKLEPLELRDIPTRGPTGERDNVLRLQATLAALLPPGKVTLVTVAHDEGCPCAGGIGSCTCETVDVTLRAVNWVHVAPGEELTNKRRESGKRRNDK